MLLVDVKQKDNFNSDEFEFVPLGIAIDKKKKLVISLATLEFFVNLD